MRYLYNVLLLLPLFGLFVGCAKVKPTQTMIAKNMMIRIAEIEIAAEHQAAYLAILREESAASVQLEPGVVCIYPMFERDNPTKIRLLEIYASKEAYQAHLKTAHFLHYKTTTLPMVKSLKLIDMEAIDPATMQLLFKKINF